jgi:5S rRNA maturation endonuclease (ribonuclease M5)
MSHITQYVQVILLHDEGKRGSSLAAAVVRAMHSLLEAQHLTRLSQSTHMQVILLHNEGKRGSSLATAVVRAMHSFKHSTSHVCLTHHTRAGDPAAR